MTNGVERVAFLALAYHELWRNWASVGPCVHDEQIVCDLVEGNQDVSLLLMSAASLGQLDARISRAFFDRDDLAWILSEVEPWRAEAILHALAAGGGWGDLPISPGIALPVAERWTEVEEMMDRWRDLGITATRRDATELHAYAMETGC